MKRFKLKTNRDFSFTLKKCILIILFSILAINASNADYDKKDYDGKEYEYDYYNDYEPLYDSDEYLDAEPELEENYYYEAERKQARPKKELALKDLNWINRSFASLAEPDCEPVSTPKADTTADCIPESPKETTPKPDEGASTTCVPLAPAAPAPAPAPTPPACEPEKPKTTTDCIPLKANFDEGSAYSELSTNKSKLSSIVPQAFRAPTINNDQEEKAKELRNMVQRLYIAQARVQLEASEIKKAQAIANEAQQQLEESANHVRAITAALQNAQQEVASSAIRAQTAQLQLAAHDQLLFAARQDVDALSSQMVGLQAAEGIAQPKANFDISALMDKLRQPLMKAEKPTPVPTIAAANSPRAKKKKEAIPWYYYDDEYY